MYAAHINDSFAKQVNKFKTIMLKVSNCNNNIHYDWQCLFKGLILKSVKTKMSRSPTETKVTLGTAHCCMCRMTHEFLQAQKQLKEERHLLHLKLTISLVTNEWPINKACGKPLGLSVLMPIKPGLERTQTTADVRAQRYVPLNRNDIQFNKNELTLVSIQLKCD
jgi:hypothetical protein